MICKINTRMWNHNCRKKMCIVPTCYVFDITVDVSMLWWETPRPILIWFSKTTYIFWLWLIVEQLAKVGRCTKSISQVTKGSALLQMSIRIGWGLRTSFSLILGHSQDPFHHFVILKTLLSHPNYQFLEILSPKAVKLAKTVSSKASNWVKFQYTWLHVVEKLFTKLSNLAVICSPLFSHAHHKPIPKWK